MQTNIPVEKKRQVLDYKAMPTRATAFWWAAMYALYSKVWDLPMWSDITVGIVLVLLAIAQFTAVGQEQRVNPFN
jgi:hypothetical protein